jgi:archaellum component FlaC
MINPEVEKALHQIIAQKSDISVIDAVITGRRSQVSSISEDQQRLRENMRALKGSVEEKALVVRYVRELNEQQDRVQSLRHEITEMQRKREAAQNTLNGMVEALPMEVTFRAQGSRARDQVGVEEPVLGGQGGWILRCH